MAPQRTCGGCGGSRFVAETTTAPGAPFSYTTNVPCHVCAGRGTVDAKASARDARYDAETLRAFADHAWNDANRPGVDNYDGPDQQASNLLLLLDRANLGRGGRAKRHINKGRAPLGLISKAAHAAFHAVPGLRGE